MALLHITHDLALAQQGCHRIVVMDAGRVVEQGPTDQIMSAPHHPGTVALVEAVQRLQRGLPMRDEGTGGPMLV